MIVPVGWGVGYAVHDDQRSSEPVAGQTDQIIVFDGLVFVDDPDTARIGLPISQEVVVLHERIGTMPHGQGSLRFEENVVTEDVSA